MIRGFHASEDRTILNRIAKEVQLMFRRPERIQYAAMCYRKTASGSIEILLITSRDTGRWVVPKGWPMKGKAGHAVAAQEAWEEAGVRGTINKEALGQYRYLKGMADGMAVPCTVQVHLMEVSGMDEKFPERKQRKMEWFSPKEAAERVAEPELKALLLSFNVWKLAEDR